MSLYETDEPRSLTVTVPIEFVMLRRLDQITNNTATTADRVGQLNRLTAAGFQNVCERLTVANTTLSHLEQMTANPLSTQADELYRRGCRALQSGWLPEAEQDLRRAADIDPYQPLIPFALGLCLARQERPAEAAQAFELCVRYSLRDARDLAAHAIVLAAEAWAAASQPDRQRALLLEHAPRFGDCAEIQFATALATNQERWMERALAVAPELAPFALRSGAHLDSIAQQLAADPRGKLSHLLALQRLLADQQWLPRLPEQAAAPSGAQAYFADFLASGRRPLETEARRIASDAATARAHAAEQSVAPPPPPKLTSRGSAVGVIILALLTAACIVTAAWAMLSLAFNPPGGPQAPLFGLMVIVGFPLLIATIVAANKRHPKASDQRAKNERNDALYRNLLAQHEATLRRAEEGRAWLALHDREVAVAETTLGHLREIDTMPARLRLDPRTGATRR